MELKVWVEGIQRVVCGITEQTTVQEVVIALAQATGRTGRYTLVEKWRDTEKLLPPSEHPIKVLEKWGEYASDVQFLLKRTGASTTSDAENAKMPERNVYRQSLPPLAKNREKAEILQGLKRKEPKRKSLTITGGGSQQRSDDSNDKKNQNSNGNNNRPNDEVSARYDRSSSGSVPANVRKAAQRFSANISNDDPRDSSSKSSKSKDKSKSKHKSDKKYKDEPKTGKTALLPPHMQKGGVSSATEALFPSESKSAVAAKSPIRKNADQIKNVNVKGGKVALMPPTHKVLKSRNSSSTSEPQSSPNPTSSNNGRNYNSGSLTPAPYSPTSNENSKSSANYAYRYGNSLPRSKKKTWSESGSASVDDKRQSREITKKTALMPPTYRQRAMTPNPQIHREAFRTSTTDNSFAPLSPIPVSSKSSEQAKAKFDFTKLVQEQQRHIEEQRDTASDLDKEIKSILDKMRKQENELNEEIAKLEEENRALELQYENEYSIAEELSAEDSRGTRTRKEMDGLQSDIDRSSADLAAYKRKMDDLTKAISDEAQLQRAKQQRMAENNRNMTMKNRKDIEHVNWSLSSMEDEIKRIEKEIRIKDGDIEDKYTSLEALNRELRQVNLQQFIRKTGSKVTVLPPETESSNPRGSNSPQNIYETNPGLNISGSRNPIPPPTAQSANGEGVWV